jgi:hypothetical protein
MTNFENIFDKVNKAIEREFGEGEKIEEGDTLVFQLNDCILVMSLEDGKLRTEFIGNKVIPVDVTTGFYD